MKKCVFLILACCILSNRTYANETIFEIGIATAESKNKACEEALLIAQKYALHQSGINIFTSFKKTQEVKGDREIRSIINNSLQKSYGIIKTNSKKETISFDKDTGYITCEVEGAFDVDTSKLKSQLLALNQKY